MAISTAVFSFTFYVNPGDKIQEAIDIAIDGDVIIVGDGTYTGDGNRDIDFHGKAITLRSENGPEVTIIDCQGTEEDRHRGLYFDSGEGPDSVVDGFTVTNGFRSYGGGIYCTSSSPTISNCAISDNLVLGDGGGIYCYDANPIIAHCTIRANWTNWGSGGGIYCELSSPTITDCRIGDNITEWGAGGGIYCEFGSPIIAHCTIDGNLAPDWSGGGICCRFDSSPTITDCTISGNSAGKGGGIYCSDGRPTIANCILNDNLADGGGIYLRESDATIKECMITNNSAWLNGGGIYCYNGSPTIPNCTIRGNSAEYNSGGIGCYLYSSMTITNCTISDNSAATYGGGIYSDHFSSVTIANCTISNNSAKKGGGISCTMYSSPTITDCTISGNTAPYGGSIYCNYYCDPAISSCTISGNSADYGGGIYCWWYSNPTLTDCILWGNTATTGHEIVLTSTAYPSTLPVIYSDVQGGAGEAYVESGCTLGLDGTNIDLDPLFVKGPLHDYYLSHLATGQGGDSPCIDTGSDTAENLGLDELSTRTDGMPDTGRVDMGYHAPYALWIHSITRGSDDITIRWNALPGVSYTVQLSTDLERWMSIPAGQTDTWTDTNASGYRKKFYRVLEQ